MRRLLALAPVQVAGATHLLQFLLQPADLLLQLPPVRLDLGLAGATQEAETATLALQMGPGPDEAGFLVVEVGEIDLQPSLRVRARAPKISRISPVRSITLAAQAFSRLRCWMGVSVVDHHSAASSVAPRA